MKMPEFEDKDSELIEQLSKVNPHVVARVTLKEPWTRSKPSRLSKASKRGEEQPDEKDMK